MIVEMNNHNQVFSVIVASGWGDSLWIAMLDCRICFYIETS